MCDSFRLLFFFFFFPGKCTRRAIPSDESRPGRAAGQAPGCRCSLARTPRNRCRAIARPRARQAHGCESAASDACRLLTSFGRSEVPSRSCCAVAQSTLLAAFCALLMSTAPRRPPRRLRCRRRRRCLASHSSPCAQLHPSAPRVFARAVPLPSLRRRRRRRSRRAGVAAAAEPASPQPPRAAAVAALEGNYSPY
jgi:hypothetical protein